MPLKFNVCAGCCQDASDTHHASRMVIVSDTLGFEWTDKKSILPLWKKNKIYFVCPDSQEQWMRPDNAPPKECRCLMQQIIEVKDIPSDSST